jgi:hypothetical protein
MGGQLAWGRPTQATAEPEIPPQPALAGLGWWGPCALAGIIAASLLGAFLLGEGLGLRVGTAQGIQAVEVLQASQRLQAVMDSVLREMPPRPARRVKLAARPAP